MKKFTKKQIQDWKDYELVRASGSFNMWMPEAREATGLKREDYIFVLNNYEALRNAAERGEG